MKRKRMKGISQPQTVRHNKGLFLLSINTPQVSPLQMTRQLCSGKFDTHHTVSGSVCVCVCVCVCVSEPITDP